MNRKPSREVSFPNKGPVSAGTCCFAATRVLPKRHVAVEKERSGVWHGRVASVAFYFAVQTAHEPLRLIEVRSKEAVNMRDTCCYEENRRQ